MTTVLTKKDFVRLVAERLNTTQIKATEVLDVVFGAVEVAVFEQKAGVKLGDIGTLKVDVVPEREHNVPNSDEKIVKPEHYAVKFKVNSAFKRDLADVEVEG